MATEIIPHSQHADDGRCVEGSLIQAVTGRKLSTSDVRGMLNYVADTYPELSDVMGAAKRLIIHLETLRHEAVLPLSLGNTQNVLTLLTQPAVVEVNHG